MTVKASGGAIASSTAQAYSTIASNFALASKESVTFRATIKLSESGASPKLPTLAVASSLGFPPLTLNSKCLVHPSSYKVHLPTWKCPVC